MGSLRLGFPRDTVFDELGEPENWAPTLEDQPYRLAQWVGYGPLSIRFDETSIRIFGIYFLTAPHFVLPAQIAFSDFVLNDGISRNEVVAFLKQTQIGYEEISDGRDKGKLYTEGGVLVVEGKNLVRSFVRMPRQEI